MRNRTEETILGRKPYCATIEGRRGISNKYVHTKRPTRVESKSMQTLKMTPPKEKISLLSSKEKTSLYKPG